MSLIERLDKFIMDGWDDTGAPYCLGDEHHKAFCDAKAEIERLRGVLENIRDHAISNGEDCAYLDAKAALESQ